METVGTRKQSKKTGHATDMHTWKRQTGLYQSADRLLTASNLGLIGIGTANSLSETNPDANFHITTQTRPMQGQGQGVAAQCSPNYKYVGSQCVIVVNVSFCTIRSALFKFGAL